MVLSVRIKTLLVLALGGLALYLGVSNLADRVNWKRPWEGMAWTQTDRGVEAKLIIDPAASGPVAGLAVGDILVSIHGVPVRTLDEYTEVTEALSQSLPQGTQVNYEVQKARTQVVAVYPVEIQLRSEVSRTDIYLIIVAFTYLGIGLFIFLRNWKAEGAFHFYLICVVSFVLYLYRHSGRADAFDVFIYWCSATAFLVLPPLFLHFCLYFPEPLSLVKRSPRVKAALYFPFLFLLTFHAAWFSGRLGLAGFPRDHVFQRFFDRVHLTHFVVYFLLGAAALVYGSRPSALAVQRQQRKWITHGALIGIVPFVFLYAVPYLVGWTVYTFMEFSILSLAFIPVTFAYAITRYKLMDVELIFKKGVAYVLTSSALLALFLGIVLLISRALQGFSPQSDFVFFALSALALAFLFAPLREKIQEQIDRYFYKEQYDYRQSFADFGRTLGSEINLSRLTEKISTRIRSTLSLAPVAIFLRDDLRPDLYHLLGSGDVVEIPEAIFSDFDRQLNPLFHAPPSQAVLKARTTLAARKLHYIQPLRVHDRLIGFLGLGKRLNGNLLSSEDLELLSTLAGYAAIAIDNALLYQSVETKAQELALLKVYAENVVENISVGVVVLTPEGTITTWNSSMELLTGLATQEAIGKNITQAFPGDLIRILQRVVEAPQWMVQETGRLYKTHLVRKNGQSRMVNVTISPFVSRDDVVTGTLLVFDDITEKVQLEDQLLQAEKLTSIGLFAAGIAHEVNTPLTGISSYAQMLLKETAPADDRYELLRKIEQQSFRASNIINNLLNFARVSNSDFSEVNVNALVVETLSLLDHQFKKGSIKVNLELDPSLPKTVGSGGKLQQVFMNIFLNAKDAMPRGGHLDIRTSHQDSTLMIEIQDNGVGIPDEHVKKIYDPFFTTKEVGKGTGLGLSVSYGIIQEHSGRITVESEEGRGTTFKLRLPVRHVN